MTATSSAPTPARRFRARAALLVALVLTLSPAAAAVAATEGPEDAAVTVDVTFAAAPTDSGVLTAGQPLTVALQANNATTVPLPAGAVSIAITEQPLTTRDALTTWLSDAEPRPAAREIGTAAVGDLAPGAERTETATIDPDATGLRALAPGVYPLTATYASARGDLTSASVVVVPDAAATAAVGLVVPITTGPRTEGLLDREELATLTAPGGNLRGQLDAVAGTVATLAVDPAIVASIRVLGSSAPTAAQAWLADLLALPNPRFALPFGDADLVTQFGAGLATPLAVPSLTSALVERDGEADAASPDPSPTAPVEDAVPTLEELLDIGSDIGGFAWPATGTAGAATVAALAAMATAESPRTTLVPTSVTGATASGRANAEGAQVLVYDADVSRALHDISVATGSVDRGRGRAAASAFAALAAVEAPGANLLVTIDRGADRTAAALRDAVGAALSLTGRTPAPLGTFLAEPARAVSLAQVDPDPARVSALTDFLTDETALTSFASILTDPTVLLAPERMAILQLIGSAWLADADGFGAAVDDHREASRTTLQAVSILPSSGVTLATSSASLGFTVRNDLPWPVSLVVITTPNDPRVIVQNTTPVVIGALQNSRAEVPVQARVGSGESNVTVQLRSPAMIAIGDSVSVDVSVRAEWETVGIGVLIALVAVMLVLGVIRTILRRRRRATEEPTDG